MLSKYQLQHLYNVQADLNKLIEDNEKLHKLGRKEITKEIKLRWKQTNRQYLFDIIQKTLKVLDNNIEDNKKIIM
jgi:hypothetical protein